MTRKTIFDITNEEVIKRLYNGEYCSAIAEGVGCNKISIHMRAKRFLGRKVNQKTIIEDYRKLMTDKQFNEFINKVIEGAKDGK